MQKEEEEKSKPSNAPGIVLVEGKDAGKSSACDGCPNQKIALREASKPDPTLELVRKRMNSQA